MVYRWKPIFKYEQWLYFTIYGDYSSVSWLFIIFLRFKVYWYEQSYFNYPRWTFNSDYIGRHFVRWKFSPYRLVRGLVGAYLFGHAISQAQFHTPTLTLWNYPEKCSWGWCTHRLAVCSANERWVNNYQAREKSLVRKRWAVRVTYGVWWWICGFDALKVALKSTRCISSGMTPTI